MGVEGIEPPNAGISDVFPFLKREVDDQGTIGSLPLEPASLPLAYTPSNKTIKEEF